MRGRASQRGRRGILGWLLAAAIALHPHHHHSHRVRHHGYPAWWRAQAACIHQHESTNWHIRNYPYGGGFQFLDSTWKAHAPPYDPPSWLASPAQQTFVAWRTWLHDGRSWREWSTSSVCGVD